MGIKQKTRLFKLPAMTIARKIALSPNFMVLKKSLLLIFALVLLKIKNKNDATPENSGYQNPNPANQRKRTQHATISDVKFSV